MSLSLDARPSLLRRLAERPHLLFWACLAGLVAAAWAALAGMVAASPEASLLARLASAICSVNGDADATPTFLRAFAMWSAMACAMMLPTAAPMVETYLDIADAAREKAMAVVPAGVLVAGYLAVWLAVSLVAAVAQTLLAGPVGSLALPALPVTGALLALAGLYQFSSVKHACLTKCRRPMPYFLSRWSDTVPGVFRMGLEQGVACLGCCVALMALMFASGLMNLAFMAVLAVAMLIEKAHPKGEAWSRGLGVGLLVAAAITVFYSIV